MNKEDVLINEIIQVLNKKKEINDTIYLKNVNRGKIKNIINEGSELSKRCKTSTYIIEKLERDFNKINKYYDNFISLNLNKKGTDKKNKFIEENIVLSKQGIKLYESIYSLYDAKETNWLKEFVQLNILLDEVNNNKNKFRCPICQYNTGDIFDKDHFLPRSIFPTLTVSRNNFIPTCRACNSKHKGSKVTKLPVFKIKNIDYSFLDKYVDISLELNSNSNFDIEVFPKKELGTLEKISIQNILDLYNLRARYNDDSVGDYCDSRVNDIVKKARKRIKILDKVCEKDIKKIINEEQIEFIKNIEDSGHHYIKLLKIYINIHFEKSMPIYIDEWLIDEL